MWRIVQPLSRGGHTRRVLATLVDDALRSANDLEGAELASLLGVSESYVSKLRKGYRPKRAGLQFRKRLEGFVHPRDMAPPVGRVSEGPSTFRPGEDPLAFVAGVLWVIERDARHIASTASVTRARLGYSQAGFPNAHAVQVAAEVLATAAEQRRAEEERQAASGE